MRNFIVICEKMQGGDFILKSINFYFISFIIYLFITLYSIYDFFYIFLFHHKQGSKLKIKQNYFN